MSYKIAGIDWGYSYTKIYMDGKTYIFPSVIGLGCEISFQMNRRQAIDNISVITDQYYFIGNLALEQSKIFFHSLRQDRFDDPATDALIKAALGLIMKEDGELRIVTGLPPKFYATHKDKLVKALKKTHTFIYNGNFRTIHVTHVQVVPQLVGTMLDLVYDDNLNIKDETFAKETIGVIDPGFGTTDLGVFAKLHYKEEMKDSIRYNMNEVVTLVRHTLYNQYGVELDDSLSTDRIVRSGILPYGEKNIDVSPIVEWAKKTVAHAIVNHVQNVWINKWAIHRIVLTGGGGEALYPFISPLLDVVKPDDAQFANVRGYYKKAMKAWG